MSHRTNFAQITGRFADVALSGDHEQVTPLQLTIRDQERVVDATLSGWERKLRGATFDWVFQVSLKNLGLKRPSVLGATRVGDTVEIHCTVEPLPDLAAKPATTPEEI